MDAHPEILFSPLTLPSTLIRLDQQGEGGPKLSPALAARWHLKNRINKNLTIPTMPEQKERAESTAQLMLSRLKDSMSTSAFTLPLTNVLLDLVSFIATLAGAKTL
ncbi:Uncharacterised protein [uncultured archaeon]|nr:Uncharacterised protein [uncultured archaeon]